MTLDQLRVFIAVAKHQHMTRAARELNLAQSAASHAIAALEGRYAIRLFDRVGRRIELTQAGQVFLAEARKILLQVQHAEQALSDFTSSDRGTLNVQASQTIASYWLPRHLADFRRAHPGITLQLSIGNTAQVARSIETGAAEIGFVEGAVTSRDITSEPIARDQLVLVTDPDHPWVRLGRISVRDLTAGDWVMREPGSGTRAALEEALKRLGVDMRKLRIVLELPSNEAVRGAVEAGLGATVISASVAAPSLEAGLLHQCKLRIPDRAFYVVRHKHRSFSRIAQRLLSGIAAA